MTLPLKSKKFLIDITFVVSLSFIAVILGKSTFLLFVKDPLEESIKKISQYVESDVVKVPGIEWAEGRDLTANFFLTGGVWEQRDITYKKLIRAEYLSTLEPKKLFIDYAGDQESIEILKKPTYEYGEEPGKGTVWLIEEKDLPADVLEPVLRIESLKKTFSGNPLINFYIPPLYFYYTTVSGGGDEYTSTILFLFHALIVFTSFYLSYRLFRRKTIWIRRVISMGLYLLFTTLEGLIFLLLLPKT
ncbi:hypothetical protein A2873_04265 [Candidatus Woesebacteria bacterium RIFCSPHIGHO2_01_FULL_42_80]|uniref:Uncharacterized protein n=1 Tax=Candidatus Woesebacteria bacterium RIFCSPHIGHO2_12_FULL_41_24 TaxID=1802510 RepID=A0A1F8AT50_9BACT|nr:MAG: hypothetical protein A2W15_01405 [Candidatus Woesebacteria bacterium RBG_16_41_13]OGM29886.1 MAG: hypothetical protein A2873_04265 [Candidatus Woesebacteria bacterium RIFCSPHIGHO2_01_FULL_42_80]OGM54936.1 MAG: hypothetical protein A3E44_03910 [Candidatus Woesebacteria bacterium RIFCSPHIGHO2_12_FULL_41_24]OGM69767.1 MAG: hypothetical protein A3I55_06080 [Candidatus Woesebacteria bacterium RIFCSPLOWO2_02_FULL_42_10]OGM74005.1 MAG: hypothetical protein A3H21_04840 [Candidatus Woesebacteria